MRVVLEDASSGIVYEIERSLKGGSTKAEIYRADQPESPLVQGTRQVTEYVTRELTGLPHAAFVSTFFTRQKELSFFGDLGATERREQVGRLLGLETIRVAQKSIGEKRTRKQAEARVKREQYEEQSEGVDFPAERDRLDDVIAEQTVQRDAARIEVDSAKTETPRRRPPRVTSLNDDTPPAPNCCRTLQRIEGDASRFQEMRATAQRDLHAIAQAERKSTGNKLQATNEPSPARNTGAARHRKEEGRNVRSG